MAGSTTNLGLTKPTYAESQDVTILNGNMDLIDAEAGKVRANFSGAYSSSQAYAVGDYCTYQGNLYRCTTAIGSSGEAWTSGHWTQVAVGDELSSLSEQIANNVTPNYAKDSSSSASIGAAINSALKSIGNLTIGKPFTFSMNYSGAYYFGIACYSLTGISFGRIFSINNAYVYSFRNNNADSSATVNEYLLNPAT